MSVPPLKKDSELAALVERAPRTPMTSAERDAQVRSFAYGNLAIENPGVTRAMIDAAAADRTSKRNR